MVTTISSFHRSQLEVDEQWMLRIEGGENLHYTGGGKREAKWNKFEIFIEWLQILDRFLYLISWQDTNIRSLWFIFGNDFAYQLNYGL